MKSSFSVSKCHKPMIKAVKVLHLYYNHVAYTLRWYAMLFSGNFPPALHRKVLNIKHFSFGTVTGEFFQIFSHLYIFTCRKCMVMSLQGLYYLWKYQINEKVYFFVKISQDICDVQGKKIENLSLKQLPKNKKRPQAYYFLLNHLFKV